MLVKAAVLHHPGEADNLTVVDIPIPEPVGGQVLIKVKAFGLNTGLIVLATTRNAQKEKKLPDNGATHILIDDGNLKL